MNEADNTPQPLPVGDHPTPLREAAIELPKRQILTEDTGANELVKDAEKDREKSYDAVYFWEQKNKEGVFEKYALHPYTDAREDMVSALCAVDLHLDVEHLFQSNNTLRPWAVSLLFVVSKTYQELVPFRGDLGLFRDAVIEWGDVNVSREKKTDAVNLALQIHNAAWKHMAVPKPSDRSSDSGN